MLPPEYTKPDSGIYSSITSGVKATAQALIDGARQASTAARHAAGIFTPEEIKYLQGQAAYEQSLAAAQRYAAAFGIGGSSGGGGGGTSGGGGGGGGGGTASSTSAGGGYQAPSVHSIYAEQQRQTMEAMNRQTQAIKAAELAAEERRKAQEAAARESAHAILKQVLELYGLSGLSDWAWKQLINNRSREEVMLDLRNQPVFKERFKAIEIRKQQGLNAVSPEDIINYENTARDMMRASGLPKGFYDQPDDFAQLIGKGVSLQSLQNRVEQSWERVMDSPPEVRQAFESIYGMQGEQALAAFMFDPDNSEIKLREMARTAVAGGALTSFGFGLDISTASRVAGLDLQDESVRQGFARLAQLRGVFNESIGERQDLTVGEEGVGAVFDAGEGAEQIDQRITARRNQFAGGGGAYITESGLAGVSE